MKVSKLFIPYLSLTTLRILSRSIPVSFLSIISSPIFVVDAFVPSPSHPLTATLSTSTSTSTSTSLSSSSSSTSTSTSEPTNNTPPSQRNLQELSDRCNAALKRCTPTYIKTSSVQIAPIRTTSPGHHHNHHRRLGLIATSPIRRSSTALSIIYDDAVVFTPDLTRTVFSQTLPDEYDGWTGEVGLLALSLLNELARASTTSGAGVPLPKRDTDATEFIEAWIHALPSPSEMRQQKLHPLLWNEDEQEVLQGSSTKKVYRVLDDVDEDGDWLNERVWGLDRVLFPETVRLVEGGEEYECFTTGGFAWAVAVVSSRSVFVDDKLRLLPYLDFCNHDDTGVQEIRGGTMGAFGTTKGAILPTGSSRDYAVGEEVFCTYGPKSAAEYLLEHGFVPKRLTSMSTCVAELTFEIRGDDDDDDDGSDGNIDAEGGSTTDPFYEDKLDVLEFDTYDSAPMSPLQTFDVFSDATTPESSPDPAMVQFLRLSELKGQDAFLLESVFRKDVWGFMDLPVSEQNERDVLETIADSCSAAIEDMVDDDDNGDGDGTTEEAEGTDPRVLCATVRESERRALQRTLDFVQREKEALDLKEYYQERRLKDLGLDSEWNADDAPAGFDADEDGSGFGRTRTPGNLDW